MKTHSLKTWPEAFAALWAGDKRHEVRVNDRDFREGDVLVLEEWDPNTSAYSGRRITIQIQWRRQR